MLYMSIYLPGNYKIGSQLSDAIFGGWNMDILGSNFRNWVGNVLRGE